MAKLSRPRHGSLQFWPRKRAEKTIPSVNWAHIAGEGILGFIAYKVGMATAIVKDATEHSMSKGKKIFIPVNVLETPCMKLYSIRFYKDGRVIKEIVVSNEPLLKRILRVPKQLPPFEPPATYDSIRAIVYSLPSQTGIKKTPDVAEVAFGGKNIETLKSLIGKEISVQDVVKYPLLDVLGLTKGKGLEGTLPRFGIELKQHKTEKGVRRPGSLAPWHPARVTFRTPQAGQLGMFSRVHYNIKVITSGNSAEKSINPGTGFKHYGKVKSSYLVVQGSVQGPPKRQILITPAFRPTKGQAKKKYEFQELII